MYESLTKYLTEFTGDEFGTWIIDKQNDGTPEHPIQMPHVNYANIVYRFIHDVSAFVDKHKDLELKRYSDILQANSIKWGMDSMTTAAIENLDA